MPAFVAAGVGEELASTAANTGPEDKLPMGKLAAEVSEESTPTKAKAQE